MSIYKHNQSVTGDITNYWIEKFNINTISEIDDIDKLNLKNLKNLKPIDFHREGYDADDLENVDIQGSIQQTGGSTKIIQNTRIVVKLSECKLFSAGDSKEIDKIPDILKKKKFSNYEKLK